MSKPAFLMCFCTGECPGFSKLELWKLINYVRNELDVSYAIIHPQLCVDDGDRFLADFLSEGQKDRVYIVGGCDPRMQRKMFAEAFKSKGLDIEKQLVSLDLRNMPTEDAMRRVKAAVEGLSSRGP